MCVQYRGGAQYRGGVQYRGGHHEYRGRYLDKCGGYHEFRGNVQYSGGGGIFCYLSTPRYWTPSQYSWYPPHVSWYPPTVLKFQRMVSPHGIHDIPHVHHDIPTVLSIPHGTQDNPNGTHDIPPRYWTPPTVLSTPTVLHTHYIGWRKWTCFTNILHESNVKDDCSDRPLWVIFWLNYPVFGKYEKSLVPSKKFHFGKNLAQQKILFRFFTTNSTGWVLFMQKPLSISVFEHFCLTAVPLNLSFYYKSVHACKG